MAPLSLQSCYSLLGDFSAASSAAISDIRSTLVNCEAAPARSFAELLDVVPLSPMDGPAVAQAATAYLTESRQTQGASSISRYEILRELGKGCFGKVFLARDKVSQQDVALKVYRSPFREALEGDVPLHGLFNELRFQAAANYPSVVRVLSCGLTLGAEPFLALELMTGGTLCDVIHSLTAREDNSIGAAVALAKRVLHTASLIHEAGILHGDIGAENFLADRDGRLKLADFALSRRLTERPYRFEIPLRKDKPPEGIAYDVFQLGKVLYQIFTRYPNEISDITVERSPIPSKKRPDLKIPTWVDELVAKALSKNPADRWPHAPAMRDALAQHL